MVSESEEIIRRYERRKLIPEGRYSPLNASTYMSEQEKERALIKMIKREKLEPLGNKRLLEIGCGTGINLLQLIRLGFQSSNLFANDILAERLMEAKKRLPNQVSFFEGNILNQNFDDEVFDIVFQSMVFSSILDRDFKKKLALKMWNWTKPGGGILWYDFIYNNPRNKDVKGVSLSEINDLFPVQNVNFYRLTLAPPISRILTKVHPILYSVFSSLYFLRTHILCFVKKPS
ncbi:MAG: class I SAM-dependent methyltransferase [Sphingobacteriaceae bacterium]|nr:class I SAM-dependent methyltransferase [Sphingobacteriaceae bacterium]